MKSSINSIKKARQLRRMTQTDLANAIGVDIYTINNWEKGIGTLSIDYLDKLMNVLQLPANLILFNDYRVPLKLNKLSKEQQIMIINIYKQMINSSSEVE